MQKSFVKLNRDIQQIKSELKNIQKKIKYANKDIRVSTSKISISHKPKKIFFTCGVGKAKEKLQSFEHALRNAGIAHLNLVRVSSIYPPGCNIAKRSRAVKELKPGQITFCVIADLSTNEPNRLVAASIGLAVPTERDTYGYLSEHHAYGMTEKKAGDYSEDLAATMLASTLGISFDPDKAYDERKEIYKMSRKIVRTRNITKTALGDKDGLWTTVVAAAVFVP